MGRLVVEHGAAGDAGGADHRGDGLDDALADELRVGRPRGRDLLRDDLDERRAVLGALAHHLHGELAIGLGKPGDVEDAEPAARVEGHGAPVDPARVRVVHRLRLVVRVGADVAHRLVVARLELRGEELVREHHLVARDGLARVELRVQGRRLRCRHDGAVGALHEDLRVVAQDHRVAGVLRDESGPGVHEGLRPLLRGWWGPRPTK